MKTERNSQKCIGKLRATNHDNDSYMLYDTGEAYDSKQLRLDRRNLRQEHGTFIFSYEMSNVGNIRQLKVILPTLEVINGHRESSFTRENQEETKFLMREIKPMYEGETLLSQFKTQHKLKKKDLDEKHNYRLFVDNTPNWNPKCNSYVYNFKGRVTEPSIKNFQLVPEGTKKDDPKRAGR